MRSGTARSLSQRRLAVACVALLGGFALLAMRATDCCKAGGSNWVGGVVGIKPRGRAFIES